MTTFDAKYQTEEICIVLVSGFVLSKAVFALHLQFLNVYVDVVQQENTKLGFSVSQNSKNMGK